MATSLCSAALAYRPYPGIAVPFAPEPARTYAAGNVPGNVPGRRDGAAVAPCRVGGNTHGQRRIAKGQKCLPVQPADVTLVDVPAAD